MGHKARGPWKGQPVAQMNEERTRVKLLTYSLCNLQRIGFLILSIIGVLIDVLWL